MPASFREFVQRLIRSTVMREEEVADYLGTFPPEKRPRDGESLARMFVRDRLLTTHQADAILKGKEQTLVLGEFIVLAPLGKGGMGEVFRASHRLSGQTVAIKVLHAEALRSRDAVGRFRQEMAAAMRLCHRNIVATLDAGEQNGVHYLVMEYVEGQDLGAMVQLGGPLPVDQALEYLMQAADGLGYAHAQNVVHRDVKPANLMLDRRGTIKVLDLGLARIVEESAPGATVAERLTRRGELLGTVDYISPEQALDTRSADHRSDIYSLGCTLFRLLTGRPMFETEDPLERLMAHVEAERPSLCQAAPNASPMLADVFGKMVAKRPGDRWQSMAEVVGALRRCLDFHLHHGSVATQHDPANPGFPNRQELSTIQSDDGPVSRRLNPETDESKGPVELTKRISDDEKTVQMSDAESPSAAEASLKPDLSVGKATVRVAGTSTVSSDE